MTPFYRIAIATIDGVVSILVEQEGRFLTLASLLGAEDIEQLGAAPAGDLMPILADWGRWAPVIGARVAQAGDRFARESLAPPERFRPPTGMPNKLICIGANFHDHIAEMARPMVPTYPYAFLKPPSTTLVGSGEAVRCPRIATMIDWEAELAVVIGQRCRDIPAADALAVVAGYTNFNDLSARDRVNSSPPIGVDWILHKALDGFAPIGPFFVPAEFVPDPQDLPMRLTVNGVVKQDSHTSKMVFGVAQIIEHLSSAMTLEPGDVIATGTPAGVGFGRKPPEFLVAGDHVEVEVGRLGTLKTLMS